MDNVYQFFKNHVMPAQKAESNRSQPSRLAEKITRQAVIDNQITVDIVPMLYHYAWIFEHDLPIVEVK